MLLTERDELYVGAAKVSGLSGWRIIARHILWVVRSPIIIETSIVADIAFSIQSGREFLGLGDPSTRRWDGMLQDAFTSIYKPAPRGR